MPCPLRPPNLLLAQPSGSSRGLSSDGPDASDGLDSEGEGITDCEGPIQHVISGTPTSSWKDYAITFLLCGWSNPLGQLNARK